ncbi:MAG: hypothetical protein HKM02_03225 [Pseudomonadales bacterium]|nr:hypothetical protein [Pseudomonadales bacterium]
MDITRARLVRQLTFLAPDIMKRLVGKTDIVLRKMIQRPCSSYRFEQSGVLL